MLREQCSKHCHVAQNNIRLMCWTCAGRSSFKLVVVRLKLVTLTAGSVAVVSEITLIKVALDACLLPHLTDLGHAQFWVGSEEQLSCLDGEVVLLPVPKILELLVVNCQEGIHARGQREERMNE